MAKKVLGKGLGAIISSSPAPIEEFEHAYSDAKDRIVELDINRVRPNPDQPRANFDEDEISNLAESIISVGLISPIIVRKVEDDYYVVAGERRLRACKIAGLRKIKTIVIEATEESNLTIALIENIQRTNLDPIEEAKAFRVLINRFKLKQQDIAQKVGKDRATIANLMRLLTLPEQIQRGISEGKISVGHAKVLLSAAPERQNELYNEILLSGISVRALENVVESEKATADKGGKKKQSDKSGARNPHLRKMEETLVSYLGTKVDIRHSGKRGKIEISYYSLDDFDRIMDLLKIR
ncbi:MAG: ParB/RepB/Spo0J family partition protein [Spirochaetes bacterium]|nr:MAG: ParB/RepB/Spo0J family partition protein [Spirochaetota bacterium]